MTHNPITIGAHESLAVAAKLFENNKIHHLPVLASGGLVGMISKSDFQLFKRGFTNNDNEKMEEEVRLNNYLAKDIMTSKLAKLDPDDKINVALEVFKENLFHAIPIVEGEHLVGIVTTYDIIKRLAIDNESHASYDNV
jgi:acetoin utilization protein AcuB